MTKQFATRAGSVVLLVGLLVSAAALVGGKVMDDSVYPIVLQWQETHAGGSEGDLHFYYCTPHKMREVRHAFEQAGFKVGARTVSQIAIQTKAGKPPFRRLTLEGGGKYQISDHDWTSEQIRTIQSNLPKEYHFPTLEKEP